MKLRDKYKKNQAFLNHLKMPEFLNEWMNYG